MSSTGRGKSLNTQTVSRARLTAAPPFGSKTRSSGTALNAYFWGTDPSTTTPEWSTLIKAGHGVVYAAQVEGVPYTFGERRLDCITGLQATAPSGYTLSAALSILQGQKVSVDCDRESGFAAGLELDLTLGRQQVEDEGLGPLLFARPTLTAQLTAAVTSAATTTFDVDSTASFAASGTFYIGRECCTYTGKTGTTFTGVTRGVAGLAHYHTASTSSAYRQCTDVPVYWVGRLVTLWEHVVSPEGRYLGDAWCTAGDYCRQVWRGYVVETPRPEAGGMVLRCAPLVRRLTTEVGADIRGEVAFDTAGVPLIRWTPSDAIRVIETAGGVDELGYATSSGVGTVYEWAAIAGQNIRADIGADSIIMLPRDERLDIVMTFSGATSGDFQVFADAWFLQRENHVADEVSTTTGVVKIPYAWEAYPALFDGWLVVELQRSADYTDATAPSSGLAILEADGTREIVSYSATASSYDGRFTAFHLTGRALLGSRSVNPWKGASITIATGYQGAWGEVLRTLATSSGIAGARGTYDTLAFGFGLGLPEDHIDVDSLDRYPMPSDDLPMITGGEVTPSELLGGWAALGRMCMVQVVDGDGECVLRLVPTEVIDDPDATALGVADVLLEGHSNPELVAAPNHVRINAGLDADGTLHVVRDAARAQAEGVRALDIKAPGIGPMLALQRGGEMLLLSDGLAAVKLEVPPWVEVQAGDAVELTTAHPLLYSWSTGAWGPSSLLARVVGWERDLWSGVHTLTLLLSGQSVERLYLCPSADVITAVSGTEFRVAVGDSLGFVAGETIAIYQPGSESTDYETKVIDTITPGASYDTITLTVALATVTAAAGIVLTMPDYSAASTRQRRYLYERAGFYWR